MDDMKFIRSASSDIVLYVTPSKVEKQDDGRRCDAGLQTFK